MQNADTECHTAYQQPDKFACKRTDNDTFDKPFNARKLTAVRLHNDLPLVQSQPAAEHHEQNGNERHKSQPARLNQNQDNRLAEHAPMRIRIVRRESCNARCGSGGEQRVDIRSRLPFLRGKGQYEQYAPEHNHEKIPERQITPYAHSVFAFEFHVRFRASRQNNNGDFTTTANACQTFYPRVFTALLISENVNRMRR